MTISLPTTSPLCSPSFIYGVATSSFQIEGGASERLPSIWDTFCNTPGKVLDGSNGIVACNHFELWEQDLDLIDSLGVDAYRFSISWPRVINKQGDLNQAGIDFYIGILDRLNEKGIKPFVTLYHWDLPQHLEDQGGWLNRQTAYHFRDYVDIVSKAFGERVHSYATLNEPFCSAYLGYEAGVHAPGLACKTYGKKAAHHLLLAHGLAMQVLQTNSPNTLNGIVLNFTPCYPETDNTEDKKAAQIADAHFNDWYIRPVMSGLYPDLIEQLPESDKPDIHAGDMDIIAQPLDFMGVNYYTRAVYRCDNEHAFMLVPQDDAPKTDMGWEIYPQAFTDLLVSLHQKYTLPPIYITENGVAAVDTMNKGAVNDRTRTAYYSQHLNALHAAILQGVDVVGYFAWSLMDNFEWAEGYKKRFGIVHVDYDTQKRTIKDSGLSYSHFINQRGGSAPIRAKEPC